jgi:hypothetical protein
VRFLRNVFLGIMSHTFEKLSLRELGFKMVFQINHTSLLRSPNRAESSDNSTRFSLDSIESNRTVLIFLRSEPNRTRIGFVKDDSNRIGSELGFFDFFRDLLLFM